MEGSELDGAKNAAAELKKLGVGRTTSFVRESYNKMLRARGIHRQTTCRLVQQNSENSPKTSTVPLAVRFPPFVPLRVG